MWIVDNTDGKYPIATGNIRDKRGSKKKNDKEHQSLRSKCHQPKFKITGNVDILVVSQIKLFEGYLTYEEQATVQMSVLQ